MAVDFDFASMARSHQATGRDAHTGALGAFEQQFAALGGHTQVIGQKVHPDRGLLSHGAPWGEWDHYRSGRRP